jgi:hypothetical protein
MARDLDVSLSLISGTTLGGWFSTRTGRPRFLVLISPATSALASGLTFWTISTAQGHSSSLLIGFQILSGLANGASVQVNLFGNLHTYDLTCTSGPFRIANHGAYPSGIQE